MKNNIFEVGDIVSVRKDETHFKCKDHYEVEKNTGDQLKFKNLSGMWNSYAFKLERDVNEGIANKEFITVCRENKRLLEI